MHYQLYKNAPPYLMSGILLFLPPRFSLLTSWGLSAPPFSTKLFLEGLPFPSLMLWLVSLAWPSLKVSMSWSRLRGSLLGARASLPCCRWGRSTTGLLTPFEVGILGGKKSRLIKGLFYLLLGTHSVSKQRVNDKFWVRWQFPPWLLWHLLWGSNRPRGRRDRPQWEWDFRGATWHLSSFLTGHSFQVSNDCIHADHSTT